MGRLGEFGIVIWVDVGGVMEVLEVERLVSLRWK
jgi:hypothetical protein